MALLLLVIFGITLFWLRIYTNHGQKLELDDYIGVHFEKATETSKKASFELIVKDSIHKVGQPGGLIISQNPPGGSLVKENRKIYVDITKYNADEIPLSSLSAMYGTQYNSKVRELSHLSINSKIKGYRHDSGDPNYILEVWYDGRLIDGASGRKSGVQIKKGGTLEFVLSKIDGGAVNIPDLVCMQYSAVGFIMEHSRLKLGSLEQVGAITDRDNAFIVAQNPPYESKKSIEMGSSISITIQQEEPESCKVSSN